MKEDFAYRLQKAMNIRNIKATELSEKANIPKSAISQYLSGLYEAKQKSIFKLANALNVSEAWLMGLDVPMTRNDDDTLKKIGAIPLSGENMVKIPILGTVKAGYDYLAEENIIGTIKVNIDLVKDGSEYFALKVKGDSMQPVLYEDDVVIIKRQNDCEDGQIAVVLINGEEGTIKKVKKSSSGIWLQPFNNNYEPLVFTNDEIEDIPVKIIGVVKQLQREF